MGITGLEIPEYGGPGLTYLEAGAILFEMAKIDGSIATITVAHNSLGQSVIYAFGDEE